MNSAEFQRLSPAKKAEAMGLSPCDDGKGEFRVGQAVWFQPGRSRKWRRGTVTYSKQGRLCGIRKWRRAPDFVRVDWVIASAVRAEKPEGMCEHGYVQQWSSMPHPCPRCLREAVT